MAVTLIGSATAYLNGIASATLTVPAGVTTSHLGVIQTTTSVPGTVDIGVTGWTQRYENPTGQGNHEVAVFTRLGGHTAGDTITVTQNSTHNVRVSAVWLDTQVRDVAVFGTVGARNGTSQATVTIPGITLTATTQDVLVLGTERTTVDGTTVTGLSPNAATQLYYIEFAADTDSSHYVGTFVSSSTTVPSQTLTWSGASGNGTGVMMALAVPSSSDFSGTATLTGSGTLAGSGTASTPPAASVSWQSEPGTTSLSLGWILDNGSSVRAVASLSSSFTSPIYGNTVTRPASGWTSSRVTGLTENTTYYTGVEVDGTLLTTGRGQYKTLRTALAASTVIASSCNVTGSTHAVFTRIKTEAPDFFAHMGDIHYADLTTYNDTSWRAAFASSVTSSTFQPMLASVPMTYDPDNHDGPGASLGYPDGIWDIAINADVRQLTGEIYAATTKGFYKTWVHAGVRYVELDRWSFRSDPAASESSSKTMLGATQKAWFLNLLQTATEPAIVVLAGFPNYSNLVSLGRWGSYSTERVEIGNAITALPTAQKNKIVFIGGDSHSICADDGTNAMWGRPSLNASPLNQTGGLASGTWNIANIDVDDTRGYYSRLTFAPGTSTLAMTWDAVRDDGVVQATWSTSFPTGPQYEGTATLTGSGSLTAVGGATVSGTAGLAGSGSLTAVGTAAGRGTGTLAGAGTLAAVGTPAYARTVALSGAGTLAISGSPAVTGTAALSGSGTLGASGSTSPGGAVALGGTGTLTAIGAVSLSGLANLAGAGQLTALADVVTASGNAAFGATGTLSFTVVGGLRNITLAISRGRSRTLSARGASRTLTARPRE